MVPGTGGGAGGLFVAGVNRGRAWDGRAAGRPFRRRRNEGQAMGREFGESTFASETPRAGAALWRAHLTFDPGVSDHSPVVRGTWITVGQVISRIVDGWSWADILRA